MNEADAAQVLEAIISWVETRCPERDLDILHDTRLLDMSLLDSMDLLEMVTYIEERYDISVDPDDLVPENFESPRRIVELVVKSHQ